MHRRAIFRAESDSTCVCELLVASVTAFVLLDVFFVFFLACINNSISAREGLDFTSETNTFGDSLSKIRNSRPSKHAMACRCARGGPFVAPFVCLLHSPNLHYLAGFHSDVVRDR